MPATELSLITDPFKLQALCWPNLRFYDKQVEIIKSVWENKITVVPAANVMGKDFVGGFICLAFFLSRHPCRIVTTSAKDDHLDVLWGELRRFVDTSVIPLDSTKGGPLIVNQHEMRKILSTGIECKISYCKGMVASPDKIAAMQGHHVAQTGDGIPRTLFLTDESSSVPHLYWGMARTWAQRIFSFGNTWPCENFFKYAVKGEPGGKSGGDIPRKNKRGYYRKIIRIKAEDSPNVRLAQEEIKRGKSPSNRIIIPGVKPYEDYLEDRENMSLAEQCVCLDADWYEGSELKLYPPEWLNRAEQLAEERKNLRGRRAKALGIDPGEGGDDTDWYVVDELGILYRKAMKTSDTSDIPGITISLMNEWGFLDHPEDVVFDRGGGGKEHADYMRKMGYDVSTIGFGEAATKIDPTRFKTRDSIKDAEETRYVCKNRRAEMYWCLRGLLNPRNIEVAPGISKPTSKGFGIPRQYAELRRQLAPMPFLQDGEGRIYLPPKDKPTPTYKGLTIKQLLGCSPNEADALVLAVFRMLHKPVVRQIGAIPIYDGASREQSGLQAGYRHDRVGFFSS
jgi:hypothetical protein